MSNQQQTKSWEDANKEMKKGCAVIIMAVILIFFIFNKTCSSSDSTETNQNLVGNKPSKEAAYAEAEVYAQQMLVSPASAEFPLIDETQVTEWDENTFVISSYVDSQNKFGAMLRSYYRCKVTYGSDGTANVTDFRMDEK